MPLLLHVLPWPLISRPMPAWTAWPAGCRNLVTPRAREHHRCTPAHRLVRKPQAGGLAWSDHVVLFPELERQLDTANSSKGLGAAYSVTPGNGHPWSHIGIIRPFRA